ncbi:MAG: HAD family hydrolase [Candidatus Brocadiia bacterium]
MNPNKRAVFLDRDGVIIRDVGYIRRFEDIELLVDVAQALSMLRAAGFLRIIVTNQSAVARGMITLDRMFEIEAEVERRLFELGGSVDAAYLCPHHPTEGEAPYRYACGSRKPEPGMLIRAALEWGIDPRRSYMIGDSPRDTEAAARAGVTPLRVGGPVSGPANGIPHFDNLMEAARHIISHTEN